MKTMKILFMAIMAMLTMTACDSDDDEVVNQAELPTAAQTFLSTYFPGTTVSRVEKDSSGSLPHFDVTLSDGTEVEFDEAGDWVDVDCKTKAVPTAIVPQAITDYVTANYPRLFIVQIDRTKTRYEIELSNDTDIHFDSNFKILYIGD